MSITTPALPASGLTLVPATPAQAVSVRSNTIDWFGKWDKCTPEEWAHQDELELVDTDSGLKQRRMTVWLLIPRSTLLPTQPVTSSATLDQIYTHFETYRIPGCIYSPDTDHSSRNIVTYSIGTVWTPPQHRRKGYARLALQLAHYVMAKPDFLPSFPEQWGTSPPVTLGDGTASTLHSDVGTKYYESCTIGETKPGWEEQGSVITEWILEDEADTTGKSELESWEWITSLSRLRELEALAVAVTRDKFAQGASDGSRTRVVILPADGVLHAHHNRSLLRLPFPESCPPSRLSAVAAYNESSRSLLVFCPTNGAVTYPPFENKGKTLEISYIFGDVPWDIVREAARREGCKRVEVWGTEGGQASWPEGTTFDRGDLYSMMAFYGKLQPGEQKPLWAGNGMWTPCRTWNFEKALQAREYARPWL